MVNEGEPAGRAADVGHQADVRSRPVQWGIERSIRPGASVPATVLVAEMEDGSLFLHGWRDGPSAYVIAEDAGPLRQALAVAFGSADATVSDVQGESR